MASVVSRGDPMDGDQERKAPKESRDKAKDRSPSHDLVLPAVKEIPDFLHDLHHIFLTHVREKRQ